MIKTEHESNDGRQPEGRSLCSDCARIGVKAEEKQKQKSDMDGADHLTWQW